MDKAAQLAQLSERCRTCKACPLWETRTNVVFGVGNPESPLMLVGEGPGRNEDLQGEPFVGAAGKLLDKFLSAIEMDRSNVYIANIVKCRPPQNRDPLPTEEDACIGYLDEQIRIIQPKLMICLGRIAALRLIRPDFKITAERGKWFPKDGYEIMATFHPAALLRDPNKKAAVFEDFLEAERRLKELGLR